jgi:hypothetical protein
MNLNLAALKFFVISICFGAGALAAEPKYKSSGKIDFEELLVQGALKRPELSVVAGNAAEGDDGLLRLRENFVDQMAIDFAEEVRQ